MSRRGMPVTKRMREERRARAEKAKAEYDKLSIDEKLAKLPVDGAKRQRARLEALKQAAMAKPVEKVESTTDPSDGKKSKKGKKQS